MTKPPTWFYVVAAIALLWNLAGLMAIAGDLSLSPADVAKLSPEQQALYAARPGWSVVGSVLAVGAGTLGCVLLLLRRRWATIVFVFSLVGIVLQDIGIFGIAGAGRDGDMVPVVLQGLVLVIGIALWLLARRAERNAWLA